VIQRRGIGAPPLKAPYFRLGSNRAAHSSATQVKKKITDHDQLRVAAIDALAQIADELLEIAFDVGLSVQQINYVIRERAVLTANRRLIRETGRASKSRVAIITGLPRSEVSRIGRSGGGYASSDLGQNPALRLLAAWLNDARFLTPDGEPPTLPIFGKKRTFEALVLKHGAGIPVRAMLDELLQISAVERVGDHSVRIKTRIPVSVGRTPRAISALGERCSDLLRTLGKNMRSPLPPMFEATSLVIDADPKLVPMVRRAIEQQSASFINSVGSLLERSKSSSPIRSTAKSRLGVTVYYFQSDPSGNHEILGRRTNLRRRRRKG
jgi:hypothetical protein